MEKAERMICSSVCDVSSGGKGGGEAKGSKGGGGRRLRIVKKEDGNSTTVFRVCCACCVCMYVCPLHSRALEYPHSPGIRHCEHLLIITPPSIPRSLPRSIARSLSAFGAQIAF